MISANSSTISQMLGRLSFPPRLTFNFHFVTFQMLNNDGGDGDGGGGGGSGGGREEGPCFLNQGSVSQDYF